MTKFLPVFIFTTHLSSHFMSRDKDKNASLEVGIPYCRKFFFFFCNLLPMFLFTKGYVTLDMVCERWKRECVTETHHLFRCPGRVLFPKTLAFLFFIFHFFPPTFFFWTSLRSIITKATFGQIVSLDLSTWFFWTRTNFFSTAVFTRLLRSSFRDDLMKISG